MWYLVGRLSVLCNIILNWHQPDFHATHRVFKLGIFCLFWRLNRWRSFGGRFAIFWASASRLQFRRAMLICLISQRIIEQWRSNKLFAAIITTGVVDLSYISKIGTFGVVEVRPYIKTQHVGITILMSVLGSWRPSRWIWYISRLRFWRLNCVAIRQIVRYNCWGVVALIVMHFNLLK